MRKRKIFKYIIGDCIVGIAIFLIGITGQSNEMEPLSLKDYPVLFNKDVIIVIGENATGVERESAVMIKENLKELTGNKPIIKNDTELLELDKRTYNLILLGTPTTNNILQEVYKLTNVIRITKEYPGKNKGILEILRNSWNLKKALFIVAGSDEWGVKAGSEALIKDDKKFEGEIMVAEFASIKKTGFRIGGHCTYFHYPGVSVITKIEKTEGSKRQIRTSGGPRYEGYEIWFVFKTNQEIKEDWARKTITREHLFCLANSWYPGPKYLEKYHIKVGSNHRCTLKVIRSGTCTPIIFEFNQLKKDDYFESS